MLDAPASRFRLPISHIKWARQRSVERSQRIFKPGTPNRRGLQFEKRFGQWLQAALADIRNDPNVAGFTLRSGRWIEYADENTDGAWAQPDHFLVLRDRIILFECKLSETVVAWHQLDEIYGPLLEHLYPGVPLLKCAVFAAVRTEGEERRIFRLRELLVPLDEAPMKSEWLVLSQAHM